MQQLNLITNIFLLTLTFFSSYLRAEHPFNNSPASHDFDILHYKIQLKLNDQRESVAGTTTICLRSRGDNLRSITLNAVDMQIDEISLTPNYEFTFDYDSAEIKIHFSKPPKPADSLFLAIKYRTDPLFGIFFIRADSSSSLIRPAHIYSDSEPEDARYWYPCFDRPFDKATSELIVTVRDDFSVLSNGRLIQTSDDKLTHTRTYHWSHEKIHATYLVSFTAGPYELMQEQFQKVPLDYYYYPGYQLEAKRLYQNTLEMVAAYTRLFGTPYPWDKYAQVWVADFKALGMENTSITFISDKILESVRRFETVNYEALVAHELAHQWFGNLVTCQDWAHLWINEGFATYAEFLWFETSHGLDAARYHLLQDLKTYLQAVDSRYDQTIVTETYTDPWEMFNVFSYHKAALCLHSLRFIIGEQDFFLTLQQFLKTFAFANANTDDFQNIVEAVTHTNYDWFFQQWFNNKGLPHFEVKTLWNQEEKKLQLNVTQIQSIDSVGLFKTPVAIEITTPDSVFHFREWLSHEQEEFTWHLPAVPQMIRFDKGGWLLKKMTFTKTTDELIFQLLHDDDLTGRFRALEALIKMPVDSNITTTVVTALNKDSFWAIRKKAAAYLENKTEIPVITALRAGFKDQHPEVRKVCIESFPKNRYNQPDLIKSLEHTLLTDSVPPVLEAALKALAFTIDSLAFPVLKTFLDENHAPRLVEAALIAMSHLDDDRAISVGLKYAQNSNHSRIRYLAFRILGNSKVKDSRVENVLIQALSDPTPGIVSRAITLLGELGYQNALIALKKIEKHSADNNRRKRARDAIEKIRSNRSTGEQ